MHKFRQLAVACALLAALPLAAQATLFQFLGNCTDCATAAGLDSWEVAVALEVKDDYVPGTALSADDFLSFSYSGSNLVSDPVTIDLARWGSGRNSILAGVLHDDPSLPSFFKVGLINTADALWSCTALGEDAARSAAACRNTNRVMFALLPNGTWSFGTPPKDVGDGVTQVRTNGPGTSRPVPDPMSLALCAAALLGGGLRLRARA